MKQKLLLLLLFLPLSASDTSDLAKDALKIIQNGIQDTQLVDDILPKEEKGKQFDSKQAKEQTLSGDYSPNKALQFLQETSTDSPHISNLDSVFEDEHYRLDSQNVSVETCTEASSPVSFSVVRTLDYQTTKETTYQETTIYRCQGHETQEKCERGKGKKKKREKEQALASDPSISWYFVTYEERGIGHRDLVIAKWKHSDDCLTCDSKTPTTQLVATEQENITNETWQYQNPFLQQTSLDPHSTLLSTTCLDDKPRQINGREYKRCWIQQDTFLYQSPQASTCHLLKNQTCRLHSSDCLEQGPFGCALWKRIFHCQKNPLKTPSYEIDPQEMGLDTSPLALSEPNRNFSDIATKLELFQQMDKELKAAPLLDSKEFTFFSGKKMRCYIHALNNVSYDCCDKMKGLAVDALLAQCDQDELALFDLRERGHCHYIGSKNENVLGVKTSKKNVYCCFSSKLARIFNEEARKQLNIPWGTAEKPLCNGLDQKQIKTLNFDRIDLTQAFETPEVDLNQKLETLKNKISTGLKG